MLKSNGGGRFIDGVGAVIKDFAAFGTDFGRALCWNCVAMTQGDLDATIGRVQR